MSSRETRRLSSARTPNPARHAAATRVDLPAPPAPRRTTAPPNRDRPRVKDVESTAAEQNRHGRLEKGPGRERRRALEDPDGDLRVSAGLCEVDRHREETRDRGDVFVLPELPGELPLGDGSGRPTGADGHAELDRPAVRRFRSPSAPTAVPRGRRPARRSLRAESRHRARRERPPCGTMPWRRPAGARYGGSSPRKRPLRKPSHSRRRRRGPTGSYTLSQQLMSKAVLLAQPYFLAHDPQAGPEDEALPAPRHAHHRVRSPAGRQGRRALRRDALLGRGGVRRRRQDDEARDRRDARGQLQLPDEDVHDAAARGFPEDRCGPRRQPEPAWRSTARTPRTRPTSTSAPGPTPSSSGRRTGPFSRWSRWKDPLTDLFDVPGLALPARAVGAFAARREDRTPPVRPRSRRPPVSPRGT